LKSFLDYPFDGVIVFDEDPLVVVEVVEEVVLPLVVQQDLLPEVLVALAPPAQQLLPLVLVAFVPQLWPPSIFMGDTLTNVFVVAS
jgi:hypothetical protein